MKVIARHASPDDLGQIISMYRGLEKEMTALHRMWPLADGLDEPVADSLAELIASEDTIFLIGEIEEFPVGFLVARAEPMRAQAKGEQIGVIRLIYVQPEAREVAVGEAMRDEVLAIFRGQGISKFDAHVLPGHRLAKNFFEAGGFSARSIVMHHDDGR